MYDINLKNFKNKDVNFIFIIFFIIGVFFFAVISVFFIRGYKNMIKLDSQTEATKIEIKTHYSNDESSTMYSPVYYYAVGGVEYVCESNSSSNVKPNTSKNIVYYEANNPSNCKTEYDKSTNWLFLLILIIPLVFIIIAVVYFHYQNKRIKVIKELNKTGKLVKGLKYELVNSNVSVNNVNIKKPIVHYTLPNGVEVTLEGDLRYDNKFVDSDGLVDLLIDENNPSNYFIDFEINRLSGNREEDYYYLNNEQVYNGYQQSQLNEELSPSQKSQTFNQN